MDFQKQHEKINDPKKHHPKEANESVKHLLSKSNTPNISTELIVALRLCLSLLAINFFFKQLDYFFLV